MHRTPWFVFGLLTAGAVLHAATIFTVSTIAPDGPGSFGQAILDANAAPGPDVIQFGIAGEGVQTITLSTALPTISEAVTVDATTQPGYAGIPLVVINGNFRRNVSGLTITATGCTVRGLAIVNCGTSGGSSPMWGLVIEGGGQHRIEGCFIGLDPDGMTAKRNRDGGILISNSVDNVIGGTTAAARNIISGNSASGVTIAGAGASNNVVAGNFIGLTAAGTARLANSTFAIRIQDGASANRIGGTEAGARNVIVGNNSTTLEIAAGTTGTLVQGNLIGLGADGETLDATPSSSHGVAIRDSAGNTVGGTAAGAGNVLSGNQFAVLINGAGASNNVVQGNLIGTDPTGKAARPNYLGVSVGGGATENLIGGPEAGACNVIAANVTDGVSLNGASRNRVQGNFIGTDLTGNVTLGNGRTNGGSAGVTISGVAGPATDNLIGGAAPGEHNVICGNLVPGIVVVGTLAEQTRIQGNFIGLGADGTTLLGNQADGIQVLGATDTWIGGLPVGAAPNANVPQRATPPAPASSANRIYDNLNNGIDIKRTFGATGTDSVRTTVIGNHLVGNHQNGISQLNGAYLSQNSILPPEMMPMGWQAIDWKGDGVSNPNSPDNAVNAPVISDASYDDANGQLQFKVSFLAPTTPGLPVQFEFFASPEPGIAGLRTLAGIEKTFSEGSGSLELRLPFTAFTPRSLTGVAIVEYPNGVFETGQESEPATVMEDSGCPTMTIQVELPPLKENELIGTISGNVSGGEPPFSRIEIESALPGGMTFATNLESGGFSFQGAPFGAGPYSFKIRAVDHRGCEVTRDFSGRIACNHRLTFVAYSAGQQVSAFRNNEVFVMPEGFFSDSNNALFIDGPFAGGSTPSYTVELDGKMVANGESHRISLPDIPPGNHVLRLTAHNEDGCTGEFSCFLHVEGPPQLTAQPKPDNKLELQWNSEASIWKLYSTSDLGTPFVPALIEPIQTGNQFTTEVNFGEETAQFLFLMLRPAN